jgi:hypothetical protein
MKNTYIAAAGLGSLEEEGFSALVDVRVEREHSARPVLTVLPKQEAEGHQDFSIGPYNEMVPDRSYE